MVFNDGQIGRSLVLLKLHGSAILFLFLTPSFTPEFSQRQGESSLEFAPTFKSKERF